MSAPQPNRNINSQLSRTLKLASNHSEHTDPTPSSNKSDAKLHAVAANSQHPTFELLNELRASLNQFIDAATNSENPGALSFWNLVSLAQEFETALSARDLFDLHLVRTLLTPEGIEEAGTANAVAFLMDRLGISRREANERVKAAQLDDDVEPDDSAGSLPPDAADDAASQDAAQPAEPTDEERAEQERQRRLREENKRAAEAATGKGQLNTQDRAAIFNELSRLLPGGSMTAEEIKRKVYQQVGSLNSAEIRRLTRQLVDQSNRKVSKAKDRNADHRRRNLFVGKPDADGCITINGTLDAAAATLATKLFNDYAIRGQGIELPEGVEDKRSLGQKYADALTKILKDAMAHANNGRPGNKGLASIVATANAKDFCFDENGEENPAAVWWSRHFHTNVGTSLNAVQMLRLGLTDNMLLALFDTSNGMAPINLDLYRGRRLASFEQRIASQIIDGCCQHPGCDRAIDLCDLHHILPFIDGGETCMSNLVPMCRAHHRQNDDTWQADYRSHMCERTEESYFRSGHVRTDGHGHHTEPRFNTGPAAQQAPGYVPPPGNPPGSPSGNPPGSPPSTPTRQPA